MLKQCQNIEILIIKRINYFLQIKPKSCGKIIFVTKNEIKEGGILHSTVENRVEDYINANFRVNTSRLVSRIIDTKNRKTGEHDLNVIFCKIKFKKRPCISPY